MQRFARLIDEDNITHDGKVGHRSFRCAKKAGTMECGLSFHLIDGSMSKDSCEAYRLSKSSDGKLKGVAFLEASQFQEVKLSPPRVVVDKSDPDYGHLHHESDCPVELQSNRLAFLATKNRLLQPYFHPKRGFKPRIV